MTDVSERPLFVMVVPQGGDSPPDEDSGFTYFSTLNEMPPVIQLLHSYRSAANIFGFLLNLHPAESDDSQA